MTTEPHLLLTRPAAASAAFAQAFAARHPEVAVTLSPILAIRPRRVALPEGAALILTSRNALAALPPEAAGRAVWCVGRATAEAAAAAGLRPEGWAEDAAGLAALMRARRPVEPLLHVAGEHLAGDLAGELRAAGLMVAVVEGYAQDPLPLSPSAQALLTGEAPVLLPLFSPRSAGLLAKAAAPTAPLLLAAMSGRAAAAWTGPAPRDLQIAAHPTSEAMLRALTDLLRRFRAA